jgi:hypothetical protein
VVSVSGHNTVRVVFWRSPCHLIFSLEFVWERFLAETCGGHRVGPNFNMEPRRACQCDVRTGR